MDAVIAWILIAVILILSVRSIYRRLSGKVESCACGDKSCALSNAWDPPFQESSEPHPNEKDRPGSIHSCPAGKGERERNGGNR